MCENRPWTKVSCSEGFLCPTILFHYLSFFLGREVIFNVEELSDLLYALAFDEGGNLGAREFQERLNVKIVGRHHDLEKHLLVHIDVICVPLVDDLRHVRAAQWFLDLGGLIFSHVLAEDDDLLHDRFIDLRDWNLIFGAAVFDQAINEHGLLGRLDVDLDNLAVLA